MKNKLNIIMWWLLAITPIIIMIVGVYSNIDIWEIFGIGTNNVITNIIYEYFGNTENTILQLTNNTFIWQYVGYLFTIEIAHLLFDLMVLVIRITHRFIDKINKGGEN